MVGPIDASWPKHCAADTASRVSVGRHADLVYA